MKKTTSDNPFISDGELHRVLMENDPAPIASHASIALLQASILAQTDRSSRPQNSIQGQMFVWLFQRGWTARAAAFASLLLVLSGFIVGQLSYGSLPALPFTGTTSLLASIDETAWPSDASDNSWGDSDDDSE